MEERKVGREKVDEGKNRKGRVGRERVGEGKVRMDSAILKVPLKSPSPGPSLILRQIDAPGRSMYHVTCFSSISISFHMCERR